MLNVKLSKKQLKVLVENINNDIDYTYRLCKQSVDKKVFLVISAASEKP